MLFLSILLYTVLTYMEKEEKKREVVIDLGHNFQDEEAA